MATKMSVRRVDPDPTRAWLQGLQGIVVGAEEALAQYDAQAVRLALLESALLEVKATVEALREVPDGR